MLNNQMLICCLVLESILCLVLTIFFSFIHMTHEKNSAFCHELFFATIQMSAFGSNDLLHHAMPACTEEQLFFPLIKCRIISSALQLVSICGAPPTYSRYQLHCPT